MTEEVKKVEVKVEEGKLIIGVDTNQDGQKLVNAELNLGEGLQEIIAKLKKGEDSEIKVDAKAVKFSFTGSKLILEIDTDKDGEILGKVEIDIAEGLDEAM